jgi:cbb3-type cytochrome oxidase maturation protein
MEVLSLLIPVSLGLGALGLLAFVWAMRTRQFDDPEGDSRRILDDRWDDRPKED